MAKWWEQIVSAGATGRIEAAAARYETKAAEVSNLRGTVETKRVRARDELESLTRVKLAGLEALGKMRHISRNIGIRERSFSETPAEDPLPEAPVTNIERVLGNGEKAMAITKGTVAGASTALGAWSLVATLGSASTGTAISSLSGAAAMNATLAWFGGGSLAAGGLGMTAGMAVVGGIVAVPAAAVVATTMHVKASQKIADIEKQISELSRECGRLGDLELMAELARRRAEELIAVTKRANEAFDVEFERVWQALHLHRRDVCRSYTASEMIAVRRLFRVADAFATILDQKVFIDSDAVSQVRP